jgi:hypothetical protein
VVFLGSAAATPARADPGGACELPRADRTRTPSSRCLACHDGSAVRPLGPSHSVEVDYARAFARSPDLFVPAAMLGAEGVTLVDGKVACVSCHTAASRHQKHALDPARLCAACHRM